MNSRTEFGWNVKEYRVIRSKSIVYGKSGRQQFFHFRSVTMSKCAIEVW